MRVMREIGARSGRCPRAAALVAALLVVGMSGCAHWQVEPDAASAVRVVVDNESASDVTVRTVRSAGVVEFEQQVRERRQEQFVVHHRAFGDGSILFELLAQQGIRTERFAPDARVRVPAGSIVHVVLRPDLTRSTVEVHDRSQWLAAQSRGSGRAVPAHR